MTTFRLSLVIGTGVRNSDVISTFFGPPLNCTAPLMSFIAVPLASLESHLAGGLAERAGVLPHRHGLRAERDAVERRMVAVLAGDRNLSGQALGRQRRDDAAGHAVVLGERRRRPCCCCRSGTAPSPSGRSPDPSCRCRISPTFLMSPLFTAASDHLFDAGTQEVGIRIGRVALDEDVVALRLTALKTASACIAPTSLLSKVM